MDPEHSPSESRRNRRLRLACSRCQKRKIKCDGQYPTCNNCKKAAVACRDGDSLRLRDVTQYDDEATRLRSRVASLEAELQDRDRRIEQLEAAQLLEARTAGHASAAAPPVMPSMSNENALSHEIGMVSTGNSSALRYIGPSSGYFLSRMLFGTAPSLSRRSKQHERSGEQLGDGNMTLHGSNLALDLVNAARSAAPLPEKARAVQLVDAYFDLIAPEYPILFRPAFMRSFDEIYEARSNAQEHADKLVIFQTYMVLALGATVVSHRCSIALPSEAYCISALERFDEFNIEKTLPGLQCILLVLVFGMYNPHMRVNVWYLNYHCIAALLDLGLQRDISVRNGISLLEQEMRTRLFWVVFTLDRTIATIMGRPIGLRDEACELRYPQPSDEGLVTGHETAVVTPTQPTYMAYALHLFKAARLNSEIKYVANSIVRNTPAYAYPPPTDMLDWQRGMEAQLDDWLQTVPGLTNAGHLMTSICQIRYHTLMIVLMRPSPAIPNPSAECLRRCYDSSKTCIILFDSMYRGNNLVYGWTVFHGLLLSIVTLLYCVRSSASLATSLEADAVAAVVYKGLNVLCAAGEYWPGAKRSRNVLDDLLQDVVAWFKDAQRGGASYGSMLPQGRGDTILSPAVHQDNGSGNTFGATMQPLDATAIVIGDMMTPESSSHSFHAHQKGGQHGICSAEGTMDQSGPDYWGLVDQADIDSLMHNFFTEFGTDTNFLQ